MGRIVVTAALLLCFALSAAAGVFELPVATAEGGILNFWPILNASCEMKLLQDNLCCLDSTFRDRSEAHNLLIKLLKRVPYPKYEIQGVAQFLHESSNGLEVGTRYMLTYPSDRTTKKFQDWAVIDALRQFLYKLLAACLKVPGGAKMRGRRGLDTSTSLTFLGKKTLRGAILITGSEFFCLIRLLAFKREHLHP